MILFLGSLGDQAVTQLVQDGATYFVDADGNYYAIDGDGAVFEEGEEIDPQVSLRWNQLTLWTQRGSISLLISLYWYTWHVIFAGQKLQRPMQTIDKEEKR
jgi:hypothetical protein